MRREHIPGHELDTFIIPLNAELVHIKARPWQDHLPIHSQFENNRLPPPWQLHMK